MESQSIVNSIGLGGAFFIGLVLIWFIFVYIKKRMTPNPSLQDSSAKPINSSEEKRQHPRFESSWQAVLENSGRTQAVHLKDISQGGAFVICQEPLALQQQFKITLNLPNQKSLQLNAEVVWSNANMSIEKVVNRGMGIKFIGNEPNALHQLQAAITAAIEAPQQANDG
jgi:Tfp pilus assembly protein PilZ